MSQELAAAAEFAPDVSHLAIEDDTPVANLIAEKQQRFLTGPLYSHPELFASPPFLAAANVDVFYASRQPPPPDVFRSLDVTVPQNWQEKQKRTYLVWEFGKPPEVVIEIMSNKEGDELGSKLIDYAHIGVACTVKSARY